MAKSKTATLGAGTLFEVSYDDGATFESVPGMTAIGATGGQAETVETTSIEEKARTYIAALETPASKTYTGNYRPESEAQAKFHQAARSHDEVIVRVNFPTTPRSIGVQRCTLLGFQVDEPTPEGVITFTVNGQASGQADWFNAPYVPVTGLTVSPEDLEVEVGGTATIDATIAPANATIKNIRYTILDTTVASVDPDSGVVKGRKAGTTSAYLVSEDGDYQATKNITVTETVGS